MKVRLKLKLPKSPAIHGWLLENREYHVLSIEASSVRKEYRIASEKDGVPALFDADDFEIVDDTVPCNWVTTETNGRTTWAPAAWLEPGFWEKAFDDEPEAVAIYKQEKKKIIG
jgi:hypothetical protein